MKIWICIFVCLVPIATLTRAQESRPLFEGDEQVVTFKLRDKQGNTPHLTLFTAPDQAATAGSINYWRNTRDSNEGGVAVDFKGIRFLRSSSTSDALVVRLVGIKNELELGQTISLRELKSGKPQQLHFGPVTVGFPISLATDAEITLAYDPDKRVLNIPEVSGQLEWHRPFEAGQKDVGTLKDVTGVIGDVPTSGMVLKPPAH